MWLSRYFQDSLPAHYPLRNTGTDCFVTSVLNCLLCVPIIEQFLIKCRRTPLIRAIQDVVARRAHSAEEVRAALHLADGLHHDVDEAMSTLFAEVQQLAADDLKVHRFMSVRE